MYRYGIILSFLWTDLVMADPGHLSDVAGHSHWLGAGALGAAALVAWLMGRAHKQADKDEPDDEEELSEQNT